MSIWTLRARNALRIICKMGAFSTYNIFGKEVKINDSFLAACLLDELTDDDLFSDVEKTAIAAQIVLDNTDDFAKVFRDETPKALHEVLVQAFGAEGKSSGTSKVDLQQDRARIKATMRMAYSMSAEELASTPYRDIVDLIAMSPHETPMGQALYYRTAKRPKQTKYNKEELAAFDKAKRFYKLKSPKVNEDAMQQAQNELENAFKKMVKENGRWRR